LRRAASREGEAGNQRRGTRAFDSSNQLITTWIGGDSEHQGLFDLRRTY
jgi:hypothetical protein